MTDEQLARLLKLRRRFKSITAADHWEKIVESFPEEERAAIRAEFEPQLTLSEAP